MICRFSRVGSLYYAVLVCLLLLLCHGKAQVITFTPLAPVGVEGQSINFTCSLLAGLVPNLEQRSPDGTFINVNTDPRVSVIVNANAVFTIQNLNSSQDNGSMWRCSFFFVSPVATLIVQIPVRYDFVSNVTRDVVEGDTVTIDFGLTAFPTPNVTFYFDGNVLQSGAGITFDAGSITFSPVASTHDGEYLVDADNGAGNATLCFILNVQSPGSGLDNDTATTQPPTTESPTIETDSGSGVDQVSSGSLLGCVAAGFTGCCDFNGLTACRTASGCFCDLACYSFTDCCPDIVAAGCLPPDTQNNSTDGSGSGDLVQEPVVFGLESQVLSVTEGAAAEVCVELLAGNITDPVTVNVRTLEGGMQTDFVDGLSSIVFVAGDARKCSQVQTIDDSSFEETETFQIMLSPASFNVEILLNRRSADILIADNDVVLLGFVEPFKTVPEAAGTVQLCVELQAGELQLPVRVRVQSSDITAEAGSDYSEVLQLLIFHIGGNTTQCFNVEIIDDASAETDETFRLSLATESVAVVAYSEAQLTIVDNEIPLMLSFRNNTPLVVGNDVTLAFAANMPLASAECAITGSNQGSRDCTDGFAEFKNINPSRRGAFTIDVTAVGTSGQSAKLTSTFRSETAGDCSAHLINEGLTVGASGAVSVQWQATGPTAANRNTDFRCTLDDNAPVNCVSPYEVEVGAGEHTLTVRPGRNEQCRRRIPLVLGPFQI